MNLADIQYIVEIAKQKSFSRAAETLLIAQPALSKRVKKVEAEYDIKIFNRTMGSNLDITEEGQLFLDMAKRMLSAYSDFQRCIENRKAQEKNCIILGITGQQATQVVLPLLQKMDSRYFINIKTGNSLPLEEEVKNAFMDVALINVVHHNPEIYYGIIGKRNLLVYLRMGSPAEEKAKCLPEHPLPVLSLEDLKDETFVVNLPGSSSYTYLDMIQKKNQVSLKSLELSNYENRIATVKAGKASYIVAGDIYNLPGEFDSSRLYLLEPEQGIAVENCLICRQGYQTTSIYKTLLSTLREIITG